MKKWLTLALSLLLALTLFGAFASAAEPAEVASYDEMIALIRDGLLAREETIRFRYTGDDYRAPSPDDLFAYGDNGAAGDYLRLSFNGAFPAAAQEEDGSYTVTPSYYTTASQEAAVAAYVSDVLAGCTATEEEAVARYLYDYLCDNVQFDLENLYNEEDLLKYTAYGAVSEGKAVCQGFAQLYYRLAKAAGLDCRIVTGTRAGENHAWNIVKLDGKWYHVDAACGAQLLDNSGYFMKPLFNKYAIVYGDYTAAEIRSYPFATASGMNDNLITGTISYTISYTLDQSTGVLTISGSGAIPNYDSTYPNSLFYGNTTIRSALIDEGITAVGDSLFCSCSNLTEVSIPESVTEIGSFVFDKCKKLEIIQVASGNAFYHSAGNCLIETDQKTLIAGCVNSVIPSDGSVTGIGSSAFSGRVNMTNISIPDGVTSIGYGAFNGCSCLECVTIPDSVTSIGARAFAFCSSLTELSLPGHLLSIGERAFWNCSGLTEITIPGSVREVSNLAFSECAGLKVFITEEGVERIGSSVLFNCVSLTDIHIAASVTEIADDWINSCANVERFTVAPGNAGFSSDENGVLFNADGTQLLNYPAGSKLTEYEIPEGVRSLRNLAFANNAALTGITIPEGLINFGANAFANCKKLKTVNLRSLSVWFSAVFENASASPLSNGATLTVNGTPLTELVIPEGVIAIGSYVFAKCAGLTSVVAREGLTTIGDYAFQNCPDLTSVVLPDSVIDIGEYAFTGCKSLAAVDIPAGISEIGTGLFSNCTSLTNITVPEGVTVIHKYAFNGCSNLANVDLPDTLSVIEDAAFYRCYPLKRIAIPDSVNRIGYDVFRLGDDVNTTDPTRPLIIPRIAVTIYGHSGTYAESYANSNYIPFREVCPVSDGLHNTTAVEASEATCTDGAYTAGERCADCGEWISGHELTEAPLGHDPAEAVRENVVTPTCTAEGGYDNVIYCARCGELLSSTPEKLAMTPHRDEVRDGYCDDCGAYICEHTETKTANEKAASCTEDGYSGDTVCDVCGVTLTYGQTVPAPGHKPYISKAAVSATCLATGSTARVSCSVCQTVLTESVETPIVWHMDENGDGSCDVCRAPLDCDRYGLCGDDCYWYVDNGTLVLSGSGATYSYADPAPWVADDFDYVYIKEGVTAVDGASFNECANVTKVFAPAGTSVSGCEKPVLTYTFTDGVAAVSGATGDGAFNAYDLLNVAYVLCLDHEVKGLRFDRLQLNAADGSEFTEYDILKSGKIVDENHFRLASGAVVNDFFVKPASYASFNRVQTLFGSEPDRNLILRVECGDLLTDEMKTDGSAYTEQLVLRFVDEPAPAEDDGHHGFMDSFIERFRATLAAILALFKKIIKLFTRR